MTKTCNGLSYLASPYSSPYGHERAKRYKQVELAARTLLEQGELAFSPIVYGHPMETAMSKRVPWQTWMQMCLSILPVCSRIYVLTLPGWEKSLGLRKEICLAADLGKPIIGYQPAGMECEEISGHDIRNVCMRPLGLLDEWAVVT